MSKTSDLPGHILIVDPDTALLRQTSRLLERQGHDVVVAATIDYALVAIRRGVCELILVDSTLLESAAGKILWDVLKGLAACPEVISMVPRQSPAAKSTSALEIKKPFGAAGLVLAVRIGLTVARVRNDGQPLPAHPIVAYH